MLHYLWMFLVGICVGLLARFIMPGHEHMGLILTGILGIAGSFVSGFIGQLINKPAEGAVIQPAGLLMSILGAIILLFIANHV